MRYDTQRFDFDNRRARPLWMPSAPRPPSLILLPAETETFTPREIEEVFRGLDGDSDDGISRAELAAFIRACSAPTETVSTVAWPELRQP